MSNSIIKTKFIPPRLSKKHWEKLELWEKYEETSHYPLTIVKAGPGHGKSTTLAAFFGSKNDGNYYWYNVDEIDADPALFFLNVFYAFYLATGNVGQTAIDLLTASEDNSASFLTAINHLINDLTTGLETDTYFILDDFHLVAANTQIVDLLTHFIKMMPPKLHLIISTRENLNFKAWASWRLKKMVLVINEPEFTLNSQEVRDFFASQYGIAISEEDAEKVQKESEGWIIALDLIGLSLTHGTELDQVLGASTESLDLLFEYLAFELLENQSSRIREFLLQTAVLRHLRPNICDQLLGRNDSQKILEELVEKGLFVYAFAPGQYRYHHLVHEFLRKMGKEQYDYQELHRRSAEICIKTGELGFAIYHSLGARDYEQAAPLIISSADKMLKLGRLDSLQMSLDELPEAMYSRYPQLFVLRGEVFRLRSIFGMALKAYKQAEQLFLEREEWLNLSNALQKIALIYLDTVQPVKAEEYLEKALKHRAKENLWEEASLLKLLAENKANKGQLDEALALQQKAEQCDSHESSDSNIRARVLLRTGRLEEARELLEGKLAGEKAREMLPRSHRETVLILSLIHSLSGEANLANTYAKSGIELGRQLNSPFIIAIAYMRLGHSYQLGGANKVEQAKQAYFEALKLVDELEVARGRAEPLMGLSLLEGFYGDPNLGLKYGQEGLETSERAGDRWLSGLLKISLGINYYFLHRLDEAVAIFKSAADDLRDGQDSFCLCISHLWLAQVYFRTNQIKKYEEALKQIFEASQGNEYHSLFERATLLGPRDSNMLSPLLLDASKRLKDNGFLLRLIATKGLAGVDSHPGYSLRINSFGTLKLWRGKEEISDKEWQREKALELFLLLFVNRGRSLHKEQLYYYLWPDADEETASRNFKVSLNALRNALEPERKPRQQGFFITKNRFNYGFNEKSGYYFDAEEFEHLIELGDRQQEKRTQIELYRNAIELHQGDFMSDILYIEWISDERERLKNIFLSTVDRLAEYYYEIEDNEEALKMADLLLQNDPCWEPAYLLKMKIYNRLNQRFLALKVYQRCKTVLDRELNVLPMPEIEKYYKRLTS